MIASNWLLEAESNSAQEDQEHLNYQKTLADMEGDFGENYSEDSKRTQIIRSINNILGQQSRRGDTVFKAANLRKPSKIEGKQLYRYVTLTKNRLKYYKTEKDFRERPALETACILLKDIISVVSV